MRVISQKKIKDFYEQPQYEQAKIPLQQWYYTVRNREYRSFGQILADFTDTVRENGLYIFSIDGGKYKIATSIYFDTQCVYVRFVASVSDYETLVNEWTV
ncbi:type II toxin-antitoxin system HigB family toxin [Prevotella sp. SGI.027]